MASLAPSAVAPAVTSLQLQMKAAALVAPDKYVGKAVWALLRLADWDQACSTGAPFIPARHLPAEFPASWVRNFDVAVQTGRVVSGGSCYKYQPLLSETQVRARHVGLLMV